MVLMESVIGLLLHTQAVKPAPYATCEHRIVRVLVDAGWEGKQVRVAAGVAWRESNWRPEVYGAGSVGLFQIQDVWQGSNFWPAEPTDAYSNARAAYRMWKAYGWRPWGLTRDGTGIDARDYSGWSQAQRYALIWRNYQQGLKRFDRVTRGCK